MTYLVTGGCGFLGSNLAAEALKRGHDLVVFNNPYRYGAKQNLDWLRTLGEFRFFHADICNPNDVEQVVKEVQPDTVFHLAGQHSSIYGGRQFSTADQSWLSWFCAKAIVQQCDPHLSFSISGDGKQVRDVLYASNAVACYFKASEGLERIQGRAFNIGGGMDNSLSLLELFGLLEQETGVSLRFTKGPWRESDQKVFVADISKVSARLDWQPEALSREGVRRMLEWVAGTVA